MLSDVTAALMRIKYLAWSLNPGPALKTLDYILKILTTVQLCFAIGVKFTFPITMS